MVARIHCRTRGGATQGWGNVYRLAAVAAALRERTGAEPVFLAEGPPTVGAYLRERGFTVVDLPDGLSLDEERELLAQLPPADLTVVEMLDVTPPRQRLWRERSGALAVFDDLCDHVYDADLVVCGQDLPSFANRELSAPGTRFLVGYDYFLARPEFRARRGVEPAVAGRIERALICFGGGRYPVAHRKAALGLARFAERTGRSIEATFVLGHDEQGALADRLRADLPGATVLGGVDDLDRRMVEHDVVVGSAGYVKLEAALAGRAQVMISTQWHQLPLAATFAARTGVPDLGAMAYVEPQALADALLALDPADARLAQVRMARAAVDGRGLERVLDALGELAVRGPVGPEVRGCTATAG